MAQTPLPPDRCGAGLNTRVSRAEIRIKMRCEISTIPAVRMRAGAKIVALEKLPISDHGPFLLYVIVHVYFRRPVSNRYTLQDQGRRQGGGEVINGNRTALL